MNKVISKANLFLQTAKGGLVGENNTGANNLKNHFKNAIKSVEGGDLIVTFNDDTSITVNACIYALESWKNETNAPTHEELKRKAAGIITVQLAIPELDVIHVKKVIEKPLTAAQYLEKHAVQFDKDTFFTELAACKSIAEVKAVTDKFNRPSLDAFHQLEYDALKDAEQKRADMKAYIMATYDFDDKTAEERLSLMGL